MGSGTLRVARGVHEFEVEYRADLGRTFAYATLPSSRYPDELTPSGFADADGDGDFRLIDITDPTAPFQVSEWGIQDIGGPFYNGQGCDADANYGHGAEPSAEHIPDLPIPRKLGVTDFQQLTRSRSACRRRIHNGIGHRFRTRKT